MTEASASRTETSEVDAVVVGAGFAGLYMLYRLRELGFSTRVFEAGTDVGGTWYWNRYPGARCDVESIEYSYSFSEVLEQEWHWTEKYAGQPEILRYINHVADRFDLRGGIEFNTRVTSAVFDENSGRWSVETDHGSRVSSRFLIAATGCLSTPQQPGYAGLDDFQGQWYHTGLWPHEGVDFTGKRVGIVGTGSSAIQAIPLIAQQAERLTVFQRTPNYSIPARNTPLDPSVERDVKARYRAIREQERTSFGGTIAERPTRFALEVAEDERNQEFQRRWELGGFAFNSAYRDVGMSIEANDIAAEFVRSKIREIVYDPSVAELLSPRDYPIGTKRLCLDTGYYETFNRDNVTLVDIRKAPISEFTRSGLRTADGGLYELDVVVFATGFDAMTGPLLGIDLRGRSGRSLRDEWALGPRSYLGISIEGFPNLFTITGPGSPSVLSNMIVSIEQHVEWIAGCMVYLRTHGLDTIEASATAQEAWMIHVDEVANKTLYPRANSWYIGANIAGKPRGFMPYVGGAGSYRARCDAIAANGYEGFELAAEPVPPRV